MRKNQEFRNKTQCKVDAEAANLTCLVDLMNQAKEEWGYTPKDIFVVANSGVAVRLDDEVMAAARLGTLQRLAWKLMKKYYLDLGFTVLPRIIVRATKPTTLISGCFTKNICSGFDKFIRRKCT